MVQARCRSMLREIPSVRFWYAGALIGLLDGAFVIALYVGVLKVATATQVLQSIAAAFLGGAAYRGGMASAALGFGIHYAVAFGWTLAYAILWTSVAPIREVTRSTAGVLAAGAVFGCCVWLTMDLLLLPLTRARATPPASALFFVMLAWHAVGVGLPIALIFRR
jgi:hypothetical protein